jgi:hypothetical protein
MGLMIPHVSGLVERAPPVIIGAMMADVSLRMTEPSSDHFSLERAVVTDYQDLRLGTSLDITGDVH